MQKIVQARPTTCIHSPQPNLSGQLEERPMNLAFVQSVTVLVDQQRSVGRPAKATVPAFGILGQNCTGGSMDRYQPGLPKLCSANRKNAFGPVHVRGSEVQCLAKAQSRDGQQARQAIVGTGPKRIH
jgi:hypothetical protein